MNPQDLALYNRYIKPQLGEGNTLGALELGGTLLGGLGAQAVNGLGRLQGHDTNIQPPELGKAGIEAVKSIAPMYYDIKNGPIGKAAGWLSDRYGEGVNQDADLVSQYLGPQAGGQVAALGAVAPMAIGPGGEGKAAEEAIAPSVTRALEHTQVPRDAVNNSTMGTLEREGVAAQRSAQKEPRAISAVPASESHLAGIIPDDATVFTAKHPETGEVQGFAATVPRNGGHQMLDIHVNPALRRQGIGKDVYNAAVAHAHDQGMPFYSDTQVTPEQMANVMHSGHTVDFNPTAVEDTDLEGDPVLKSGNGQPVYTIHAPTPADEATPDEHPHGSWVQNQGGEGYGFQRATPEDFVAARGASTRPGFLTGSSAQELSNHRLFLSPDQKVGYAIDPNGDLQNVFNNGGPKGAGQEAVKDAVANGATTLDAFDGHLPNLYNKLGFEAYGRMPFNDEYAPQGWDYAQHGKPDVVFMRRSDNPAPYQSGTAPVYTDYDAAKADGSVAAADSGGAPPAAAPPGGMAEGGEVGTALGGLGELMAHYAPEAEPLAEHIANQGGVTYSPTTGALHNTGTVSELDPAATVSLDHPPAAEDIHSFLMDNQDTLNDPSNPGAVFHVTSDDQGNHFMRVGQHETANDTEPQTPHDLLDKYLSSGVNAKEPTVAPTTDEYGSAPRIQTPWTPGQQTVANPKRNAFPGVYNDPRQVIADASGRVGPEDPLLQRLFGVSRADLSDLSQSRQGNELGVLPGATNNPQGSAAARAVMTPQNEQRLIDVLSEARKAPGLYQGMTGWYAMDPLFQHFVKEFGPEEAIARYKQFNTLSGMASPGSPVDQEIARGSAANWLHQQGRFNDFTKYGGGVDDMGGRGAPADMADLPGHMYHRTAQALPMQQYLESGEMQMESPKVPMYIGASGVPETGFQTSTPVGDAHWARGVGLADTRGTRTMKGKEIVPGSSVSTPEMQTLAPWWRDRVAGPAGLQAVPGQALAWGAFSPYTGVKSAIGAPKLEILATQVGKMAQRLGITPEEALGRVVRGEAGAFAEGGHALLAKYLDQPE